MRTRIRRPAPATAISVVALFVAIGGTGYAASQINTDDIAPKAVTGGKLAPDAVKKNKIKDNNVTGDKVNEDTLTEVPSAASAKNADKATDAENVSYTKPFFVLLRNLGDQEEIAKNGEVSLIADCHAPGPDPTDTTARVLGATSGDATVMDGSDSYDGSTAGTGFMPPAAPADDRVLEANASIGQPGQTDVDGQIDSGWILGQDSRGLSVDAETLILGVNYLGARCVVAGMVSYLQPR